MKRCLSGSKTGISVKSASGYEFAGVSGFGTSFARGHGMTPVFSAALPGRRIFPDVPADTAVFFCRFGRKKPGILVPDPADTADGFLPPASRSP